MSSGCHGQFPGSSIIHGCPKFRVVANVILSRSRECLRLVLELVSPRIIYGTAGHGSPV